MKISTKTILRNSLLSLCILMCGMSASAQTPQWDWVKGTGGNCVDGLRGVNYAFPNGAMHLDSAGNVYEMIFFQSSSITLGSYTFTNTLAPHTAANCLVKYSPQGTVLWADMMPRVPGSGNPAYYCPISLFTNEAGYSYLLFWFQDSIDLGTMSLVDTTFGTNPQGTGAGTCIAEYDPNGNLIELHAHKSANSYLEGIWQFNGDQIFAFGISGGDTLNGHPVPQGAFIGIMDSTGNVLRALSIGYDTLVGGFPLAYSDIAVGRYHACIGLNYSRYTVFYPSAVPYPYAPPYAGKTLLIQYDSLLDHQWVSVNNMTEPGIYSDQQDEVFLTLSTPSDVSPDTLTIDTSSVVLPFIRPLGQYSYLVLAKINSAGGLQWVDTFLNEPQNSAATIGGICTDKLDNAYIYGSFASVLNLRPITLTGGSAFVSKLSPAGQVSWALTAQGNLDLAGIAEDGHGNVYVNGSFAYSTVVNTFFGTDTLICHTPISGYPTAPDVYTARIGSCAPAIPAITASGPLSWCGADSVILSAPQAHSYLWSDGDTTKAIAADSSGQYSVYAIDSMGCYAQSALTMVWAHPQPSMSASVAKEVSCFGDSTGQVSLSANGGTPPYTYSSQPPVSNYQAVGAGTYYINLSDSNGCMAKDTVTLTQPASALSVQIDTIFDGAIAIPSGATPPYTLIWSDSLTGDTISGLSKGWYAVTVTDTNGCRATDSVFVTGPNGIAAVLPLAIRVYPDPGEDVFYIETAAQGQMHIYDANGTLVYAQVLYSGKIGIDASSWPAGTYIISIETGNGSGNEKWEKR